MNEAYSDALKEAFTLAPNGEVYLETLEITHPSIPGETVWLVKDLQNLVAFDEGGVSRTFEKAGFDLKLPPSGDNGETSMSLAIFNTDERVTDFLNQAKEHRAAVKVTFRAYLASEPSGPQNDPPSTLNLTDIKVGEDGLVTGKCTLVNILNRPFASKNYKREEFAGLANL